MKYTAKERDEAATYAQIRANAWGFGVGAWRHLPEWSEVGTSERVDELTWYAFDATSRLLDDDEDTTHERMVTRWAEAEALLRTGWEPGQ